ncbi:MAG: ATP-binding protein [Chitinophagaceae bacterium]
MTSKKIVYYILAAFITGNLLLIYVQYNSAKNINALIDGNQKLLDEFRVEKELQELGTDIVTVENKVRGAVDAGDTAHMETLENQITDVQANLGKLQKINDDDSSVKFIDELDLLVREKLKFSNQILDTFHIKGKVAAERFIYASQDRGLSTRIALVSDKIDSSRQQLLAALTGSIDKSGQQARTWGTLLITFVLISGAALFWSIVNRIGQQNQLINQLDASEKKVREAAQVKENFLTNMSHEIRTPMNAILGFTNLLKKRQLDNDAKVYVKAIEGSGENLLTIINDILDLSKIEAGMMRIESIPFSIRGLLHSIETMFREKMLEKKLTYHFNVQESVPDILEGDATRLTQVLVNLISNSIKFTQKGTITVDIKNDGINEEHIRLGIIVADTGIGIDKEKLSAIFERFQQAEDSITRKYGGTGLGLSIVNDLVALQYGTIEVESEPDKGTTFHVIISYRISAEQQPISSKSEAVLTSHPAFENTHILVVEDNEINQSLVEHLFKNWQLSFDMVNNGRKAVDILQTKKYDLILMDIQMPEMDGYTATKEIRDQLRLTTPIVAMTAHALSGEREKCLAAGMDEYISKPIREDQLYRMIVQFTQANVALPEKPVVTDSDQPYKYINLGYMREVSNGNKEYEKTITEQFMEAIPENLLALDSGIHQKNAILLAQIAHEMKTSISVMGLNDILQPYLDAIEYDNLDETALRQKIAMVKEICTAALEEARQFYQTF